MRGERRGKPSGSSRRRAIPARAGRTQDDRASFGNRCRAIPARAGRTPTWGLFHALLSGPSPRVWGELFCVLPPPCSSAGHPRACGENAVAPLAIPSSLAGHPRACGENDFIPYKGQLGFGPSPRVRGERLHPVQGPTWLRAIPARAGRTVTAAPRVVVENGPSPRVRGELVASSSEIKSCSGPSPRVRGEPIKTTLETVTTAGHPRACGENAYCACRPEKITRAIPARAGRTVGQHHCGAVACGPSPRVRGELVDQLRHRRHAPGHPRACGENPSGSTGSAARFGPSPRVRGEHSWPVTRLRCSPGHPRACGENAGEDELPVYEINGPSPRVRGERPRPSVSISGSPGPSPRVRGEPAPAGAYRSA